MSDITKGDGFLGVVVVDVQFVFKWLNGQVSIGINARFIFWVSCDFCYPAWFCSYFDVLQKITKPSIDKAWKPWGDACDFYGGNSGVFYAPYKP